MLDKIIANQTNKWLEDKVSVLNCIPCLSFSKLFSHQEIFKMSLCVIERWFTTVADSESFLELDFTLVAAILNSSELLIDSELQVFNAMNAWLNRKCIERKKHANYLLQKVRLSLLTVPALNNILDKYLLITQNDECSKVVKKLIEYKNKLPFNCKNILPRSRHCGQNNFKLVVVGGENENTGQVVRNNFTVDGTHFSAVNNLSKINYGRFELKTVCIKGEVYVFGGIGDNGNPVMPVEKYSPDTNTWNVITQMYDRRINFCACSFIDSLYVLTGFLNYCINSCLVFDTTNITWKEISRINEARFDASCVVFEGRIVVSGGLNNNDEILNTVEAYDHVDNSWTNMPNMIEERYCHKSVAIKNKLFIVGGVFVNRSIEVFDSHCNKFVLIKQPTNGLSEYISNISDALSIGNKIVIFSNEEGCVLIYDVDKNKWSRKSCEATKNILHFSCYKLQN